jgi:hypothetical protein
MSNPVFYYAPAVLPDGRKVMPDADGTYTFDSADAGKVAELPVPLVVEADGAIHYLCNHPAFDVRWETRKDAVAYPEGVKFSGDAGAK